MRHKKTRFWISILAGIMTLMLLAGCAVIPGTAEKTTAETSAASEIIDTSAADAQS